MSFLKYPSLERLGTTEVEDILEGRCYVFPKIDGTNASLWFDGKDVQAGSRTRHLSLEEDNAGFLAAIQQDKLIKEFFNKHPYIRLYGEWLVPHSLRTYGEKAWRKFYIFDVYLDGRFLKYEDYQPLLEEFKLEYIPPIFIVERPTEERIFGALPQNTYLIQDGMGEGEGVVIKNYDFVNRFGRTTWAKLVTSEFKAKHTKALGPREVKEKARIEDAIAAEFVTRAIVDKTFAKVEVEHKGFSSKNIPQFLNMVYYDIVREDMWEILKKFKSPTIDFGQLQKSVFAHIKVYKPEIFGVK